MKTSIWDILTALILLGILGLVGIFAAILVNPNAAYNPLRAQPIELVPTIALIIPSPTLTPTFTTTPIKLPPTWTPTRSNSSVQPTGQRTLRPTSTIIPTNTPVIVPTLTKVRAGSAGGGGGRCSVESQSPRDGTYLLKDANVELHWVLKNTSGKTWMSDSTDVHAISGSTHTLLADLPYDVSNNSMVDITLNLITPSAAGKFIANFGLVQGSEVLCQFFVQFNIQ